MSPEYARAIDRAEFQADCRSARARAHALVEHRRREYAELVKRCTAFRDSDSITPPWPVPFVPFYTRRPRAKPSPIADVIRVRPLAPTLTFRGETLTHTQWSQRTGLSLGTIRSRVKYGWDAERILTVPPGAQMGRPRKLREPCE